MISHTNFFWGHLLINKWLDLTAVIALQHIKIQVRTVRQQRLSRGLASSCGGHRLFRGFRSGQIHIHDHASGDEEDQTDNNIDELLTLHKLWQIVVSLELESGGNRTVFLTFNFD